MRIGVTLSFIGMGMLSMAAARGETGGDQILDGIGETALIARYLFDGHLRDASRNGFNARRETGQEDAVDAFAEDPGLGTVLSLPGGDGGCYLRLPGQALAGADSLAVTGWWFLRSEGDGGLLFDFRSGETRGLTARLGEGNAGLHARLAGPAGDHRAAAPNVRMPRRKWIHLAVVFDASQQTIRLYGNGERVGRVEGVGLAMDEVFDFENAEANRLYLGGAPDAAGLDAALHDVRLYNVGLTDDDVSRIYRRASRTAEDESDEAPEPDVYRWKWALAAGLGSVPDLHVDTWQGHLPHLPFYLPARYDGGRKGPPVRVVWPAPADNAAVLETGTYSVTGTVPGTALRPQAHVTVKASDEPLAPPRTVDGADLAAVAGVVLADRARKDAGPERALEPFPLSDVVLEQDDRGEKTRFMENRDQFVRGLLAGSPDRFLYMFRDAFGQPQPEGARPLGLWDSRTTRLRGHATGHYLTALAQAYAGSAGDEPARAALREKIDYCVETLYELARKSGRPAEEGGPFTADPRAVPPGPGKDGYDSDLTEEGIRTDYWNWGEGFISAYPPDQFIMLEHGATYGGSNNQVWAPYYTLDKILKGLLDCYEVTGDEKALAVARGMGLWVYERLKALDEATLESTWNRYIAGEYGGMNTVMARLHAATGDERFIDGARLFDNLAFFYGGADRPHGLARNVDTIRGRHSNQHIPQIIGALQIYRQTGEPGYYRIAENFWNLSYHSYTYSIGGVAGARVPNNAECYTAEPDHLFAKGFSEGGQNETCATYNLLKLTRDLFAYHPHGRYMDYYEQALYNHILASVALDSAGNTYHVPLNPGARKHFGNPDMTGFTCCNGTALDSNTKLHDSIYFRSRDHSALYVNLYVPSTLTWRERNVTVRQRTRYPYGETVRLTVEGAGRFALHVRIPGWVEGDVSITVNGEAQALDVEPGTYLALDRNWADGDTVELRFPFAFRFKRVMDRPDLASLFYGPVLLAVEESAALPDWRRVTLDAKDPGASIEGDPGTLRFRTNGLELKPFFEFGTERHSVYLKVEPAAGVLRGDENAGALPHDYPIAPVRFHNVEVADDFWAPRLETSRRVTIPHCFEQCEATGRIANFERAAGLQAGEHQGSAFNDSDVYKIMEGAAYALHGAPDEELRRYLERLVRVIAAAQWEDGYLFTYYSLPERQPDRRWTNIPWIHEQYCVGHLYDAAVAHHKLTGNAALLDVARKNADMICDVFRPEGRTDPPGHQQIEIGLCALYRVTGERRYLDQARFFLEQRGRRGRRGPDGKSGLYGTYGQDHLPVAEQREAVGHAVRAAYMYAAMADVAALTGDPDGYVEALDALWDDVVGTKLYITGGIGAAGGHEGFGDPYELPNRTAYAETCASIANILWSHRMFLTHGDAGYIDVLELSLYNAALSGVSLEGDRFYYPNVLESTGQYERSPWFGCACCPSNVARFVPMIPGFAYAVRDDDVYVNLFLGSDATVETAGNRVRLVQQTRYPWEGDVTITVEPDREEQFAVLLRIPGWASNRPVPSDLYSVVREVPLGVSLKVNGQAAPLEMAHGFARVERRWKPGDTIELTLPMPVRRIVSHPEVRTNHGKVALQRGPLVYCLEGVDNDGAVLDVVIPDDAELAAEWQGDLLGGVVTISGQAETARRTLDGRIVPDASRPFTAVPYYARAHRGRTAMTVWPARLYEGARPRPAPTLTYRSRTTASFVHVSLEAIKDQSVPLHSADTSNLHLDFWPRKGTTEWVQFAWDEAHELSSVKVYWFDDTGRGECRVPATWRVLYRDADGRFQPVANRTPYAVEKDTFNRVEFAPVTTATLRIEIDLQENWSAGIHEVVIE